MKIVKNIWQRNERLMNNKLTEIIVSIYRYKGNGRKFGKRDSRLFTR